MKKTKRLIAILIIACMVISYIPIRAIAISDEDKANSVEIMLRNALGVTIKEGKATISYENGEAEVTANGLEYEQNNNWDFGNDVIGTMYFLYSTDTNLTFETKPEENYNAYCWVNGNRTEIENNTYVIENLQKGQGTGYSFDVTFENSEVNPGSGDPGQGENTTYSTDFGSASWDINGVTVTASVEGKDLTNGAIELAEDEIIILTNFDPETMEVRISATDGFNTTLTVNEDGETSYLAKEAEALPREGGFVFEVLPKNDNHPPEDDRPEPNEHATVAVTSDNTYAKSYKDARIEINGVPVMEVPENYQEGDPIPDVYNGEFDYFYDDQQYEDGKVEIIFASLFIQKFVGTITVNNETFTVSDFINYEDKQNWLDHYDHQLVGICLYVTKADYYAITVNVEDAGEESVHIGNFLWTTDPKEIQEDAYIGNSKLEFVKIEYELNGQKRIITNEDEYMNDGYIEYETSPDEKIGSLVVPDGAIVTMRIIPEYGYQVTSFGINGQNIITGENISEFSFPIGKGNFHLGAQVTKVENVVNAESAKVKEGTIQLGGKEIDTGSLVSSVEDINLTEEQISNFEQNASGYTISTYLNINLEQVLYKGTNTYEDAWKNPIRDLNNEATITLQLENGVDGNGVVIVHEKHDGTFEIIPTTYDSATNTITFKTSSFSNYAIASKTAEETTEASTTGKTTTTEEKTESADASKNPTTGDNIIIFAVVFVIAVAGIFFMIILEKKAKKE